jgi:hypothetical protein
MLDSGTTGILISGLLLVRKHNTSKGIQTEITPLMLKQK